MSEKKGDRVITFGIMTSLIGVLFLISNIFDYNAWELISTYWPLILIGVGAWVIIKELRR